MHAFNPSTQESRGRRICEFKASLVYKNQLQDRLQNDRETLSQKKNKKRIISSCTCAHTTNKAASNHQNMVNSDIVDSLMFRCLDF